MHPQTLRIYEQRGLVPPAAHGPATRGCTPTRTSERLRLIQQLTSEVGLNLAGVERVLHMEDEIAGCGGRIGANGSREMRRALEDVHRSYRATSSSTAAEPPMPRS